MAFDLLIKGGTVWLPEGAREVDVAVLEGRIAAVQTPGSLSAATVLEAHGLHVLPGVIDTQVHFREPGMEYKENLFTGSQAAVLGGVTAVCEMPNTRPTTSSAETLTDKLARARGRMACDYAFFLGATAENVNHLDMWEQMAGCAGVKVFMGSSTGTLLVEDDTTLTRVLSTGYRRIAVHCEDETRLRERRVLVKDGGAPALHYLWRDSETALIATKRILHLAKYIQRRVHILHVSTSEEISILRRYRDIATVEVTPQHLTFAAPMCYESLGTLAQINPPIRAPHHREALWRAVNEGVVDCLGSDHAPHTLEEKAQSYPSSPSGMPGVQTLVPVMLTHVAVGRLSLSRFVELTSAGPARLYAMAGKGYIAIGFDADFTVVDLKLHRTIDSGWLASRCGWSPFEGMKATGWPIATVIRGHIAMREGCVSAIPSGMPLRFQDYWSAAHLHSTEKES
ncbi:Dihydroorotase [invertebrate metagenome]|uniref:Dihydroorotase n=1 Tax=invertebrate metagenome TaxID=1711999 RepID=A0A484HAK3_9ZZZZ